MKRFPVVLTLMLCTTLASAQSTEEQQVADILDALHHLVSEGHFDEYFELFTVDAIFLGTDATERWSIDDFKAYAEPHAGQGWTYTVTERHIYLSDSAQTAWFDERLNNETLGECRGSGVLVRTDDGWKIAQYNLTIPIPNDLANDVVEMIRNQPE